MQLLRAVLTFNWDPECHGLIIWTCICDKSHSRNKTQGPRLLKASHFMQAKSLCELLVQHGISVNHLDVAWHSPEVVLRDVKGQWFWFKTICPPMRMITTGSASPVEPHSNRARSIVICALRGVLQMDEEKVVADPVGQRIFQNGMQPQGTQPTESGTKPTVCMFFVTQGVDKQERWVDTVE